MMYNSYNIVSISIFQLLYIILFILSLHNQRFPNNVMPAVPEYTVAHRSRSPVTTCWCECYYGTWYFTFSSSHLCEGTDILRAVICTGAKTAWEFYWMSMDQSEFIPEVPFAEKTAVMHIHSRTNT